MDPILLMFGLKIAGGLMRGFAARSSAQTQGAADDYNAQVALQRGGDAIARGAIEEGRIRSQTSRVVSAGKAAFASSGVDVQSGSPLDVLSAQAGRGELAAQTVRNNAAREALGFKGQADMFQWKAQVARQTGDQAMISDVLGSAVGAAGDSIPLMRVGGPTIDPEWAMRSSSGYGWSANGGSYT